MATQMHRDPNRPFIDPHQLEAAGRALRQWLDRLLGSGQPEVDTSIAWEDGEAHGERPDHQPPAH